MHRPPVSSSPAVAETGRHRAAGRLLWLAGVAIVFATIIVYLPVMRGEFVFDDAVYVTENQLIRANNGLYRIWFTTEPPDYYPLTWSMLWLQWHLWGDHPEGYHIVNVLLHAVCAVLVWLILKRLKIPGGWLAALIFAIHPVNAATAAWISEQKNTLSMCLGAAAVLLYLKFEEDRRWKWYGGALAVFLLALLGKTGIVMLPLAILGCVWWQQGRLDRRDVLCSLPFFVLSLILGLVTVGFQQQRVLGGQPIRTLGFLERLAEAGCIPWFYLHKVLAPVGLSVIYSEWDLRRFGAVALLPGLALVVCLAVFWWNRKTWGRAPLFGAGYFVAMLFPVLGFIDQGFYFYSLVADHWQYYSIIGIIALLVGTGAVLCGRLDSRNRYLGGVTTALVLLALGSATWMRANVYARAETLWRDTLAKNPNAWLAHFNLGNVLLRDAKMKKPVDQTKVKEAIDRYKRVLQFQPGYVDARNNLGGALLELGREDEAMEQFQQALSQRVGAAAPSTPANTSMLGHWWSAEGTVNARAYYNMGNALERAGRVPEAIEYYQRALQVKSDYADARHSLGNIFFRAGKVSDALLQYEQAVAAQPDQAELRYDLGVALVQVGRVPDAANQFDQAVRIKPDYAEAHNNLGLALLQVGAIGQARRHCEEALRIWPDYVDAHYNLGNMLLQQGDKPGAVGHYAQVVRLKPDHYEAHNNMGVALFQLGKLSEAKQQFEETLRLKPDYLDALSNLVMIQSFPQTTRPGK